jgi:predicted transcriptional regulator YheO
VITGGDQQISLLADAPTAQAVSEFVEALQSRIRQRLIYLRVRPHDKELSLSYKKQALEHLQEIGIIDTQMAVRILADLEEQHTTGDTPIGF